MLQAQGVTLRPATDIHEQIRKQLAWHQPSKYGNGNDPLKPLPGSHTYTFTQALSNITESSTGLLVVVFCVMYYACCLSELTYQ